jgi:hypothetical protein
VKPLTKLNFNASSELELNALMLKSQFSDYWNCCKNKQQLYEFWMKLIGEEATRESFQLFYPAISLFRKDVTKWCNVNILPVKRKETSSYNTNCSLDVTKVSNGAVIDNDSTSDPIDNEMASKKAKQKDKETATAELSHGVVICTEESKVVVEAEVSHGVIVGSDAETNIYAEAIDDEAMDDVLSYDSSFVSNEHTDQDNVSGSVNNIDRIADDAVRHDRNDPCDQVELDENIFLPHQQVVRQFKFNGVNAEQDALSFQFEMTKVILMVREGTVLKDYYVYLIFLRCIEREKNDINVYGWNFFFGRFNKFVRTKVLSFLKAAMVVWVLNGNEKDNLQSIQQIIDNRQAHRTDFETFDRDTAANRVYAKALLNRVSEQVYFINLLVIDSPLVHSLE